MSDICSPIKDISELLNWTCDYKCWIHKHDVKDISKRSNYLSIGNGLDLRNNSCVFSEYKLSSELLPKTIFCHDFKGGYLEDKLCTGSPNTDTYRFFHWAGIDLFIYFSHELVTVPTRGWLQAAHVHGVPVLGTLITEHKDGEQIWKNILSDVEQTHLFSKKLAEICAHFKFDGYLLNVENVIPKELVPRLVQFVRLLKAQLNVLCPGRTWLLWYDSVTTEGALSWQNKLCDLNKPFFDACDGIFLNYVWTPADLLQSVELAGHRRLDVFVGVDVWGRNCYQDGGFNADKALAVARSLNMSVALFAPAWTFEAKSAGEEFLQREIAFWKTLWPHLYVHGPAQLPFETDFCQGVLEYRKCGRRWFNLGLQQYQPTAQACGASCVSPHPTHCLKISAASDDHSKIFHRVFTCDFSGAEDEVTQLAVTLVFKNLHENQASKFRIFFVVEDRNSIEGTKKVCMWKKPTGYRAGVRLGGMWVSGSVMDFTAEEQTHANIRVHDSSLYRSMESQSQYVTFVFKLRAKASLTEVLVLPPSEGAILWTYLRITNSASYIHKDYHLEY